MKRTHTTLRRLVSAAAAIFAGTTLALAVPATASAATAVDDDTVLVQVDDMGCVANGERHILWVIKNNNVDQITITDAEVIPLASPLDVVLPGKILAGGGGMQFVGQVIGPAVLHAELAIKWLHYPLDETDPKDASGEVTFETQCERLLKAEFSPNCDGTTNVKLINDHADEITFNVNDVEYPVSGGSQVTVPNVPASPGGDIQVTANVGDVADPDTLMIGDYMYVKPDLCTPTGTDVTATVGLGALLIVAGATFVLVTMRLRRRRVRTL